MRNTECRQKATIRTTPKRKRKTHGCDPLLSALPKEDLEALARAYDSVLAKHRLPAVSASHQDGPQNQIESNAAIEKGDAVESTIETV
jgi:hypothetical protein